MLPLLDIRKPPPPSDGSPTQWFYLDPHSMVHGPYSSNEMTQWVDFRFFSGNVRCRTGYERDFHTIDEWRRVCGGHLPFRFSLRSFEEARRMKLYTTVRRSGQDLLQFSRMNTPTYINPHSPIQPPGGFGRTRHEVVIDSDCDNPPEEETLPPPSLDIEDKDAKEYSKYINTVLEGCEKEFYEVPEEDSHRRRTSELPPLPLYDTTRLDPPRDPWHFDEVIFHERIVASGAAKRQKQPFGKGRMFLDTLPSNKEKLKGEREESEERKKKENPWNLENVELPWKLEKLKENEYMESWRITLDAEKEEQKKREARGDFNPWLLPIVNKPRVPECPTPPTPAPATISRGTKTSRLVQKVDVGTQTDPIVLSAKVLEDVLSHFIGSVEIRFEP